MSMVGIGAHFLVIFTVCKFAFLIYSSVFLVNLVFFIMNSSTFPHVGVLNAYILAGNAAIQ